MRDDTCPYSDELTAQEQELGFSNALVDNPRRVYEGHPAKVVATVLSLGAYDRIVKYKGLGPIPAEYLVERFGRYDFEAEATPPDWYNRLSGPLNSTIDVANYLSLGHDAYVRAARVQEVVVIHPKPSNDV